LVTVGRWAVIVSMLIAAFITPALKSLDQAYQFIQEYVGFLSPGVLAIFLLGLYWKRTTTAAAFAGAVLTIPISTALKFLPAWTNGSFPDFPFIDRMGITFLAVSLIMIIMSLAKPVVTDKPLITVEAGMFKTTNGFKLLSIVIIIVLIILYTVFW